MRAFAFAVLSALVVSGFLVPDAKAQCYSGGYYYPSYSYAPIYYPQTYYYPQTTYYYPQTYYCQPTTSYYTKPKTVPAPKITVTESYYDTKKMPSVGISESSSFDRPPIITESRSFDYPKPKVGESVTPGPVENKLPLKKIEMPQPDPEVKALKENVSSLQDSIRELKELVKQQQAELAKAKALPPAPVVAPEPRKIEAPSPMKKPSEFDKEPKK